MKILNYNQYQYNSNNAKHPRCHAELGSASDRSAKPRQSFGLSNKSMPTFSMGQTLKRVQGDSSFSAYMQGGSFYYHPNINYRISFGALKKNQFDGIDFAVVEKFKAPIEKFNSNQDLQNWAKEQAECILNTDFGGRQKETRIQRKAMLKEWSDYVLKNNVAYNNSTALLILNAITKDLKPNNDNIPPMLNKGVLADCIFEIEKKIKDNKKCQFDLTKMYITKLRALYLDDTVTESGNTGWVIIPSKINDAEHFSENVEKLKALSHKNWCTKSYNAEPYLSEGDFHVYLENGQPKLGVRFVNDEVMEIQGEENNCKVPFLYFNQVKEHILDNNVKLNPGTKYEVDSAQKLVVKMEIIKNDLKTAIENKDAKAIFEYFGITVKEDEDGFWTISEYKQPALNFTFSDIGIDENMLFKKVKKIEKDADFNKSQIKNLQNLKTIGGLADFSFSQITNLGALESIGNAANFENSQIVNLGSLKSIGGIVNFASSLVTDLGNLKTIGDFVYFGDNSKLTSLGNLESIGGSAHFEDSQIEDLGKLEYIGNDAYFGNNCIKNLGKIKTIKGKIHSDSKLFELKLAAQCYINRIFSSDKKDE